MYNNNFIIDDFGGFEIKDEVSDMPQWYTWDPAYGDKKNTPTEIEYGEMVEEPRSDVDDTGICDTYIGVTVKLNDETNSGGNIATVKQCAADVNVFSIVKAHNNPLLDTR